jgi:ElaB/YqjD/DUF883 family membrane-anchored ribosome-binding protein
MAYQDATRNSEDAARSMTDALSDKAQEYANKAGQKVEGAIASAEKGANAVLEGGRDAGARVQEVAGNMKTAVDRSVRDQPMATLAVAAAMGFVLGALWKS